MKMQEDEGPLYLFVFDGQGKHGGRIEIENMDECAAFIERAARLKETVTITGSGDECVFRCERGRVAWPSLDKLFPAPDTE
jgi:hypothetical protein